MQHHITAVLLLGAALLLVGCGGQDDMSRPFGLARDGPGDTARVQLPPLSVPPNIGERPLRPGASAIPTAAGQPGGAAATGETAGQQAFLDAAGGSTVTAAELRQKLDEDSRLVRPDPQFVSDLLNWAPPPGHATLFQPQRTSWWSRLF